MHILITGGQGYIGNYLTEALLESCNFVTTLDSGFNSIEYDFSQFDRRKLRRFNASVCNPDVTYRAMEGVDVIFHLAGRSDFENTYRHPMRLMQSNVEGITNLLCMANRAGVNRVIFTSSASVYGNVVPAKETDPCNPVNMYGATKLAAEAICRGFYQRGMDIVILRLFNVWGLSNSKGVISKFLQGHNIIYGDGQQTRDFVHISDVLKALKLSLEWDPGIYNIGTGEEVTISGIYHLLRDEEPEYRDFPISYDEPFRSCADIGFVSQFWKPEILMSELNREKIKNLSLLTQVIWETNG